MEDDRSSATMMGIVLLMLAFTLGLGVGLAIGVWL